MWSLLAACSLRAPSASVVGARIEAIEWDTVSGTVSVAVDHPGWVDVPLTALAWTLAVDGRVVAGGVEADVGGLGADGITVVDLPVTLAWRDLAAGGPRLAAPWTFSATVDLDTPLGPVSLPVERRVTLPVVDAPRLADAALRRDGVAVVLDVWLGTPRVAGFGLGSLGWRAELGGRAVGTGALLPGAATDARGLRLLTRCDGAALLAAGWSTITSGPWSVGLALAGRAETPWGEVPFSAHPTIGIGG